MSSTNKGKRGLRPAITESTICIHLVLLRIVLAIVVLGFTAATLSAQQANAPLGFDAMTLRLEIPGGRLFLSLEPIPVRLLLENRTGRPMGKITQLYGSSADGHGCSSNRTARQPIALTILRCSAGPLISTGGRFSLGRDMKRQTSWRSD